MGSDSLDASVVIPTFNRRHALTETLSALAAVEFPRPRWEVIVVDDGSSDGTDGLLREWECSGRLPLRWRGLSNSGPASARNAGAASSRGRTLIFIDNDILVPPGFLREHLATLEANPGCWVIGRIIHPQAVRATPFGRYRDALWESFHAEYGGRGLVEIPGMTAANVALPRGTFEKLGGFDPAFTIASGEDWDLGMRARRAGVRILYNPEIVVVHNDWAIDLDRFCLRQELYSASDVLLFRKYGPRSPRASLVLQNSRAIYGRTPLSHLAKYALRWLLVRTVPSAVTNATCEAVGRLFPDSRVAHRAYEAAVALAIFRGVHEGVRRYGLAGAPGDSPETISAPDGAQGREAR